jgi:hypothetical protein
MMPFAIVDVWTSVVCVTNATCIGHEVATTTTSDSPVTTFTLGDHGLPALIKGTNSEPCPDRDTATFKRQVIRLSTDDLDHLVGAVKGECLTETIPTWNELDWLCSISFAVEFTDRISEVSAVEVPESNELVCDERRWDCPATDWIAACDGCDF